MKLVGTANAKNNLSLYLDYVRRGGRVRIMHRNVAIADLVPIGHGSLEDEGEQDDEAELAKLERDGIVRRGRAGPIPPELLRSGPRITIDTASLIREERSRR